MTSSDQAGDSTLPAETAAALSRLREAVVPAQDLWPAIASRLCEADRPGRLAGLRADLKPARELWPQIESRIHRRRAERLRAPWIAAAGLAATLVFGLGLKVAQERPAPASHAPLKASAEMTALLTRSEPSPVLRAVSIRPLTPETRALLRANLKIVSSAEAQIRRARAADPDSAYLDRLLSTTQQQKQDLRYALAER